MYRERDVHIHMCILAGYANSMRAPNRIIPLSEASGYIVDSMR